MSRFGVEVGYQSQSRSQTWAWNTLFVVAGTFFVALCARLSLPLPFTPVPLSLANFAVLAVGMLLGSRMGFATLALYLAEGTMGLPVFSPVGPGGVAQLFGPTGGYLIAYPAAAFIAGWIWESGKASMARGLLAALGGNVVVFAGGIAWLFSFWRLPLGHAIQFGLYPFLVAEVAKMMAATALATRVSLVRRTRTE